MIMFWSKIEPKLCMHGTLRLFPVFISPIVWDMCEHLHYESAYFKELHKEQEYYIQSGGSCSVNY